MATATMIGESLTESVSDGFLNYNIQQVYQVIADNRDDPPSVALNASGLPAIGQVAVVAGTSANVWCTSRAPVRVDAEATGRKWHVTCAFTNFTQEFDRDAQGNPVTDPVDAVKRIDISFQEYSAPVTDATLKRFTKNGPDWSDNAGTIATPPWLQSYTSNKTSVWRSNGVPVLLERTNFRKVISVTQSYYDWLPIWDTYIGAINSDSVTLQEVDADGVRWQETYEPYTLRMRPPQKENIWKDKKLYFRRTMIMEHNADTWIHAELDADSKRFIFVGQAKPGGGTYTQSDLDDLGITGEYGYEEITTKSEDGDVVSIGNAIKLNGYGMEMPLPRADSDSYEPNGDIYSNWYVNPIKPFAVLNL